MKGLQRSLSRAPIGRVPPSAQKQPLRLTHLLDGLTVDVVSVTTAIGFGSVVIADFPEGNILILGAVCNITLSGPGGNADLTDTWEGNFGVGSTPASDATISGADEDIIVETDLAAATAEIGVRTRAVLAAPVTLNNTDNSLEINLNVLIDAAHIVDDKTVVLTVTGELEIVYQILGDD